MPPTLGTGGGRITFDDGVNEVSGTWSTERSPSDAGPLVYIMVDSVAASCDAVVAQGGEVVQPIGADAPEITALFRDPGGNVFGLYQDPGISSEAGMGSAGDALPAEPQEPATVDDPSSRAAARHPPAHPG